MSDLKTKGDRVKESIEILKKLRELGVLEREPGYQLTKEHFSKWVNTGEAWSGDIYFPMLQRKAEIVLPARADRVASLLLKAPFSTRNKNH
jgi:predicted transcriptional regulator